MGRSGKQFKGRDNRVKGGNNGHRNKYADRVESMVHESAAFLPDEIMGQGEQVLVATFDEESPSLPAPEVASAVPQNGTRIEHCYASNTAPSPAPAMSAAPRYLSPTGVAAVKAAKQVSQQYSSSLPIPAPHASSPVLPNYTYPAFNSDTLVVGTVKAFREADSYGFFETEVGDIYFHHNDYCYADIAFNYHAKIHDGVLDGLEETPYVELTTSRFQRERQSVEPLYPLSRGDHAVLQVGTSRTGRIKALYYTELGYYKETVERAEQMFVYKVVRTITFFGGTKITATEYIGFDYKALVHKYRNYRKPGSGGTESDQSVTYQWWRIKPMAEEGEEGYEWAKCSDPR